MTAEPKHRYTLEDYLALERESEVRYEYRDGEVFDMSGGTRYHDIVMDNVRDALKRDLGDKPCRILQIHSQSARDLSVCDFSCLPRLF
ncbi:MAG TPA: Uma2 family endonuclease [Blastocatellia bacterium]|nr:Uma2 family endonuclease [Blastocatellia bacterium]HMV83923.1 Uma2 family endonuclease [Blastocatellia bacterium]HMX25198.1 Uma2 family endonuclease [Blastocatellia bacterium]HMY72262.1 Uma2 family endonuclease [Blastocatellia bacterium]HMZ17361.1 Uma2 family endonuclease [Blastocatellia bacterium]